MRQQGLSLSLLAAYGLAALVSGPAALGAGSKAPPVEPRQWLNNKGPLSWETLKGRVILVEKWSTT